MLSRKRCRVQRTTNPAHFAPPPHLLSLLEGIAAPTSVVDDVAERFGRPRAHSLSRRDMSLPAWEEEDAEGGAALPSSGPSRLEDRRRTMSMSFAEEYRRGRPNRQVTSLRKEVVT